MTGCQVLVFSAYWKKRTKVKKFLLFDISSWRQSNSAVVAQQACSQKRDPHDNSICVLSHACVGGWVWEHRGECVISRKESEWDGGRESKKKIGSGDGVMKWIERKRWSVEESSVASSYHRPRCLCVCVCVCVCARFGGSMSICFCVCMCLFVHVYTFVFVCSFAHTHTVFVSLSHSHIYYIVCTCQCICNCVDVTFTLTHLLLPALLYRSLFAV